MRLLTSWLLTAAGMINGTLAANLDAPVLARVGLGASAPLLIYLAFRNLMVARTQEGITQ